LTIVHLKLIMINGLKKSPTSIFALGCAEFFVTSWYDKYESSRKFARLASFYNIGEAFFFAIEI